MALFGCDTLVVLPPLTGSDAIIFGKNSDRPSGEVQEILYVAYHRKHSVGMKRCNAHSLKLINFHQLIQFY